MDVCALVLAAGSSRRFGGEVPKVYLPLRGQTVLQHTLSRVRMLLDGLDQPSAEIVLAVRPQDRSTHLAALQPALEELGVIVVDGGETRQESMLRALAAAPKPELVLIHDAARPFFPLPAASEAIRVASRCGAAVLAIPVTDTLKRVTEENLVLETIDRNQVVAAQTPQVIRRDLLEAALAEHREVHTDDVGLLELAGHPVRVVAGSLQNLKITTREDLELAEQIAYLQDRTT